MPQSPQSITIDKWIDQAKHYVCPPVGDALVPNRDLEYLLWQDKAECILSVNHKVLVRGPFEDRSEFVLTLRLLVPASSGFWAYYVPSPIIVIDRFIGNEDDDHAPEWVQCQRLERRFWQQRSLMLDLLLYFAADLPENSLLCSKVETWCKTVSCEALQFADHGEVIARRRQNTFIHSFSGSE
ncbi:hypothetical protein HYPSUDRAFT_59039 [Hypholoma sublateritium FD-334 SS-4]|uniref:Uncharacterized protein n=1 Tax=Hypholoma sublateritium (strain FD-334 SS-4) TaxID=945553 RepID=A0A0D2KK34_HYPSF|nr:hypothetical protein HYPSUDRAFT_59039 [Hypholoma sublateritium FD-334 SS-4]